MPGFYSPDAATRRGRSHLRRLGYRRARLGPGPQPRPRPTAIIDGVLAAARRAPRAVRRAGERRRLELRRPARPLAGPPATRTRCARSCCLGSPWRPEGEHTRTTAHVRALARAPTASPSGPSRWSTRCASRCRCPSAPIYSRTDGIVNWRACALDRAARLGPARTSRSRAATSGWSRTRWRSPPSTDRLAQDPARLAAVRLEHAACSADGRHRQASMTATAQQARPGSTCPRTTSATRLAYRDGKCGRRGLMPLLRLVVKTWFRSEVRGMDKVPGGRGADGVQPLRRPDRDGRAGDRGGLRRHFGADRPLYCWPTTCCSLGAARAASCGKAGFLPADPRERPRGARRPAASRSSSPVATTTCFRPTLAGATSSTSTAARATSGRRCEAGVPDRAGGEHRRPGGPDPPLAAAS